MAMPLYGLRASPMRLFLHIASTSVGGIGRTSGNLGANREHRIGVREASMIWSKGRLAKKIRFSHKKNTFWEK